jgi:hypothetical protein
MKAAVKQFGTASALAFVLALAMAACGGGGGGYGGGPTSPTSPSGSIPTVTIRAGGTLDPQEIRIEVGQQVRFVNEDSQAHHPQSNPHLTHTDCPQANVAVINPGQSATTNAFPVVRSCGYHDHMNPDATRLHGTIRIGGDTGPTGPVYIVHD